MGTWGDGLYDNDSALDYLGDLLKIDETITDIFELTTRIGLATWFNPVSVEMNDGELEERIKKLGKNVARLPEETRKALETLLADPKTATNEGSRKPEVDAVIGGYCDGPRIDALLRFPEAKPIIEAFGEKMAKELDNALKPRRGNDLYEVAGSLAPLGIIIELATVGLFQPAPDRVNKWRSEFEVIDKNTKSERRFWWKYVRRVQMGFDLLAPRPQSATPAKSMVKSAARSNKPSAPAGPVERYQHPKLGVGMLVGRSGRGDEEKLDLRFEDGSIRKILAKFVTRLDN